MDGWMDGWMRTTTTTTTGLVFRVRTSRINVRIAVRRWGVDEPRWTVFEGINEERIDSESHVSTRQPDAREALGIQTFIV